MIQPDVPSLYKDHSGFRNMFFISTGLGNVTHRPPSDYEHLSAFTTIDDHQRQLCASFCPHAQKITTQQGIILGMTSKIFYGRAFFSLNIYKVQVFCNISWKSIITLKPFKMFLRF